jgi:hypothetical protein
MGPLFFIAIVAFFIAASAWFSHQKSKKRTAALQLQADQMGLQFDPVAIGVRDRLMELNLMTVGRAQRVKNLISGDAGDVKISIFDYQYTTGSGKNSRTHIQTVVALESVGIGAPAFSMRQQNAWLDRIGKFFGGQDIDFEQHPKFSEMFVLKGPNEDAIRKFFTPKLIQYFETKFGHCVEGAYGKMILYKSGAKTPPQEIKAFLASAYEVYGHIVDGS